MNKIFLSICLVWSLTSNCQSKQDLKRIEKLFKDFGYTPNHYSAALIKKTKEFVVPALFWSNRIRVMKWSDIDSVLLWDTTGPYMHMFIYGTGIEYIECEEGQKCNSSYYDTTYFVDQRITSMQIIFPVTDDSGKVILTKKVRGKIRKAIQKLKAPVKEYFVKLPRSRGYVDTIRKEVFLPGHIGETYIDALEIQKATELNPILSTLKIISFVFYSSHNEMTIQNEGNLFNDGLRKLLQRVRPGVTMVFDEIKVLTGLGTIKELKPLIIFAK